MNDKEKKRNSFAFTLVWISIMCLMGIVIIVAVQVFENASKLNGFEVDCVRFAEREVTTESGKVVREFVCLKEGFTRDSAYVTALKEKGLVIQVEKGGLK